MRINKQWLRRITAAALAATMLFTAISLTGCKGDKRATQGNMGDWDWNDLQPGDLYAEIAIRGHDDVMRFILFEELAPNGVKAFVKAAEKGYYGNRSFHRVLEDILIQGGAHNMDGTDIAIPDEDRFDVEPHANARNFFGALGFAVDEEAGGNYRQFYVVTTGAEKVDFEAAVTGVELKIERLDELEERTEEQDEQLKANKDMLEHLNKIPDNVKKRYEELGGYYLLDDNVTVFGQIIYGQELLRELAAVDVVAGNKADDDNESLNGGRHSRPAEPIFIESVTIVRVAAEIDETETQKSNKK
ncbi:MAG: peptidylprolyl isomerase [Oscillospiraceae bacterium]|nr:peptidylprolyl isomerase [Oscillospiraceae bacterium]